MIAGYGSGSDDADASEKSPEVIDVDQVEDSRMKELREKWTAQVRLTQHCTNRVDIQLPDTLIEKLETMIKNKSRRAQGVRTSWSVEDRQTEPIQRLRLGFLQNQPCCRAFFPINRPT